MMKQYRKKVVVFFNLPGLMDAPLNQKMYLEAHRELAELIEERGGDYYFTRGKSSYQGDGVFSNSWKFVGGEIVEKGEVRADIIYDKGAAKERFDPGIEMINPLYISDICAAKDKVYELFPSLSPKSFTVSSQDELTKAIDDVESDTVVIKPTIGYGGEGIEILDKEQAKKHQISSEPVIVQQFIDTSGGINGIVEGVHDLRVVIMGGEAVISMVRTPPEGSLIANLKRGGSLTVLDVVDLPSSAMELVREVDKVFEETPKRVYSVDMAYQGDRPYLIELNSRPGLWNRARGKGAVVFQNKLASLLLSD